MFRVAFVIMMVSANGVCAQTPVILVQPPRLSVARPFTIATPQPLTTAQKLIAVTNGLKLTKAPTLGQPLTLSVNFPFQKGKAWLSFNRAITAADDSHGLAQVVDQDDPHPAGDLWGVSFKSSGQPVLIDCRAFGNAGFQIAYFLNPQMVTPPDAATGMAQITENGHTVVVVEAHPAGEVVGVAFRTQKRTAMNDYYIVSSCELTPLN